MAAASSWPDRRCGARRPAAQAEAAVTEAEAVPSQWRRLDLAGSASFPQRKRGAPDPGTAAIGGPASGGEAARRRARRDETPAGWRRPASWRHRCRHRRPERPARAVARPGQEVARLIRDSRLELDARVPELDLAASAPASAVRVLHGRRRSRRGSARWPRSSQREPARHRPYRAARRVRPAPGMFARAEIRPAATAALTRAAAGRGVPRGPPRRLRAAGGEERVALGHRDRRPPASGMVEVAAGLRPASVSCQRRRLPRRRRPRPRRPARRRVRRGRHDAAARPDTATSPPGRSATRSRHRAVPAADLAGLIAFPGLRINNIPDIDLPAVSVTVTQPGAAPSELETQVTRQVEDAVAGARRRQAHHLHRAGRRRRRRWSSSRSARIRPRHQRRARQGRADARRPAGRRRANPSSARSRSPAAPILTYTVAAPRDADRAAQLVRRRHRRQALLVGAGVAPGEPRSAASSARSASSSIRDRLRRARHHRRRRSTAQLARRQHQPAGGRGTVGGSEQAVRTLGRARLGRGAARLQHPLPDGRTVRLDEVGDGGRRAPPRPAPPPGWTAGRWWLSRCCATRGASEVGVAGRWRARAGRLAAEHPERRDPQVTSTVELRRRPATTPRSRRCSSAPLLAVLVVWLFLRDWRATPGLRRRPCRCR